MGDGFGRTSKFTCCVCGDDFRALVFRGESPAKHQICDPCEVGGYRLQREYDQNGHARTYLVRVHQQEIVKELTDA